MKKRQRGIRGIRILHEDDDVIVIEKAAGVLTQETARNAYDRFGEHSVEGALTDWVRKGQAKSTKRVYLVHRLDRETSGVMMLAKTEAVQEYFRANWNELTEKVYLARVAGTFETPSGSFESYLREDEKTLKVRSVKNIQFGKFARTEWKTLETERGTSLMEVTLKSGRKNQIRVHFSEAGHPVLGDAKYGVRGSARQLCLHAWRLTFVHPRLQKRMTFEAPPPAWA